MLDVIEKFIVFDEHIMRIEEQIFNEREQLHVVLMENWC